MEGFFTVGVLVVGLIVGSDVGFLVEASGLMVGFFVGFFVGASGLLVGFLVVGFIVVGFFVVGFIVVSGIMLVHHLPLHPTSQLFLFTLHHSPP
jgi:hypothetical protein